MEYVIKIGKNYIGVSKNGAYTEVHKIEDAYKGTTYHKLSNILNNCVSPEKRKQCKIVEVKFPSAVKALEKTEVKLIQRSSINSSFDEVITKLKAVGSLGFKDELDELYQKESLIDQEISDIYHYIEFSNFNAADGYKAYKLLKEALLRRRKIKDEVAKYKMVGDLTINGIFDGTLDEKLNDFENRTYTPRVLKHLFEKG